MNGVIINIARSHHQYSSQSSSIYFFINIVLHQYSLMNDIFLFFLNKVITHSAKNQHSGGDLYVNKLLHLKIPLLMRLMYFHDEYL